MLGFVLCAIDMPLAETNPPPPTSPGASVRAGQASNDFVRGITGMTIPLRKVRRTVARGTAPTGLWPSELAQARIRFISVTPRQTSFLVAGTPLSEAISNLLSECSQRAGIAASHRAEEHPLRYLSKYDRGYAPPFVHMTGNQFLDIGAPDINPLRSYLLEGGMLLVEPVVAGSRAKCERIATNILAGVTAVEIPADDPLFREPYAFTNGAPFLVRDEGPPIGVRHDGRWAIVLYTGGLSELWKPGITNVSKAAVEDAFRMGLNIVHYGWTRYIEASRQYRQKPDVGPERGTNVQQTAPRESAGSERRTFSSEKRILSP